MVSKVSKDPTPLLQLSRVPPETVRSQAEAMTLADLETIFQVLSRAEFEMRRAPHPRFVLEMALVEATEARSLQTLETLLARLSSLETKLLAGRSVGPEPSALPLFTPTPAAPSSTPRPLIEAPPPPPVDRATGPQEGWGRITRLLERQKRSLAALLAEPKDVTLEGDRLIVTLQNGTAFARSTLDNPEHRRLVAEAAAEAFARPLKVEYRFQGASSAPAGSGMVGLTADGSTQLTSSQGGPRQPTRSGGAPREPRDPQPRAVPESRMAPSDQEALRRHPMVRRAVELFDGQVVRVRAKQPK